MAQLSFEYFPPKTPAGRSQLAACAAELARLEPRFVSVTYGAAGSDRERSLTTVEELAASAPPVAAHITTVGSTAPGLQATIDSLVDRGVHRLVALRGDQPDGAPQPQAYASAAALVDAIRHRRDGDRFDISVAAYPEVHPKASSAAADLDSLKAKLDAGADRAITQFFFDPTVFLRFVERARAAGIEAPIVPGIMPVGHLGRIARFADACGATVPPWLHERLGGLDDEPDQQRPIATTLLVEQCQRLLAEGVEELHFYTMNRAELTAAACRALSLDGSSTTAGDTPTPEPTATEHGPAVDALEPSGSPR